MRKRIIALVGVLAASGAAQAQDQSFFVSNLGQATVRTVSLGYAFEYGTDLFVGNPDGIVIESIEAVVETTFACLFTVPLRVHLIPGDGGEPSEYRYAGGLVLPGSNVRAQFELSSGTGWTGTPSDSPAIVLRTTTQRNCVSVGFTALSALDPASTTGHSIRRAWVRERAADEGQLNYSEALALAVHGRLASEDNTLASIEVGEGDAPTRAVDGFRPQDAVASATVSAGTAQVRLLATPASEHASVRYSVADADPTTRDIDVDVAPGNNWLQISVTSDTNETREYSLLIVRLLDEACAPPDLTGRVQVWSATVGVEPILISNRTSRHGYEMSRAGTLSTSSAAIPPYVDLQVESIQTASGGPHDGALSVVFGDELYEDEMEGVKLHVCDAAFALSDASVFDFGFGLRWNEAGLDWSTAAQRHVVASVPASARRSIDPEGGQRLRLTVGEGRTAFECAATDCSNRAGIVRRFVVRLDEGKRYEIVGRSPGLMSLDLYRLDGTPVARAGGYSSNAARLEHVAQVTGDVLIDAVGITAIQVSEAGGIPALSELSDCTDAVAGTACVLKINDIATARIGPRANDVDHWTLRLREGRHYRVTVSGQLVETVNEGVLGGSELTLYDQDTDGAWTLREPFPGVRSGRVTELRETNRGAARNVRLAVAGAPGGAGTYAITVTESDADDPRRIRLSAADAEVQEVAGASLAFVLTLSEPRAVPTSVDYETVDGTATAGDDYTAQSGTLVFAATEVSKTVMVPVLHDDHDEGRETMSLRLSNVVGATLATRAATGTIVNGDPVPKAWLARFGRTVAEQVIDAVETRLSAPNRAGLQAALAGQNLPSLGGGGDARTGVPNDGKAADQFSWLNRDGLDGREGAAGTWAGDAEAQARMAALSDWLHGPQAPGKDAWQATAQSRTLTGGDFLTGTSFALTGGTAERGLASIWGRGALSRFDGQEGDLKLDGEVASAMLGLDWTPDIGSGSRAGAWTAGLLVAHSRGEGSYSRAGDAGGAVSSVVTGLYPYGRYVVNPRVTLWGLAGSGAGTLTLTPREQRPIETDLDLAMAAAGVRGVVVEAPSDGGLELAVTSDAMAVRTTSDAVPGLVSAEADVTRLRLGLEGSWRGLLLGGGILTPRGEIGLRRDGGDADTGLGADVGAGLAWRHAESGVSANFDARGLLTHAAEGFRDRGVAGSLSWDPDPLTERGPKLTLTHTMGGAASGGMDALLGRETLAGLAASGDGGELENRRLELRVGYGFAAFRHRFTSMPELGLGLSSGQREFSVRWRLDLSGSGPNSLALQLEASRREYDDRSTAPPHAIGFRLTARW